MPGIPIDVSVLQNSEMRAAELSKTLRIYWRASKDALISGDTRSDFLFAPLDLSPRLELGYCVRTGL
jgi:hypothetical protein